MDAGLQAPEYAAAAKASLTPRCEAGGGGRSTPAAHLERIEGQNAGSRPIILDILDNIRMFSVSSSLMWTTVGRGAQSVKAMCCHSAGVKRRLRRLVVLPAGWTAQAGVVAS